MQPTPIAFLVFAATYVYGANLNACLDPLPINGINFPLTHGVFNGPYVECEYNHAFSSPQFCFYNATTFALTHAPNVPKVNDTSNPNLDSNAACPTTLPRAGSYRIEVPGLDPSTPSKCITMSANTDGAPVVIQDCDFTSSTPGQIWSLVGSTIRQGNKCLDVTNGANSDGVKLQVWTCVDGNANQQFLHTGGAVLTQPNDIIRWALHSDKCVDLTDGNISNGNPIQLWTCGSGNRNQMWFIP